MLVHIPLRMFIKNYTRARFSAHAEINRTLISHSIYFNRWQQAKK